MGTAVLHSRALAGVDAPPVTVEVHLGNGLPSFSIVGLADADLVQADLRDARLKGALLQRANLSGARLDGADLRGANLSFTSLAGALAKAAVGATERLPHARVTNLSRALEKLADLGWRAVA